MISPETAFCSDPPSVRVHRQTMMHFPLYCLSRVNHDMVDVCQIKSSPSSAVEFQPVSVHVPSSPANQNQSHDFHGSLLFFPFLTRERTLTLCKKFIAPAL